MQSVYLAVDVQNLEASANDSGLIVPLGAIIERAEGEGFLVTMRAYADWTEPQITERLAEYRAFGFELIQLVSDSRGKNTADIMLALDMLEVIHLPDPPDVYIVISGDGDFAPLAQKVRRHRMRYVAMGFRGSSSNHLQRVADDFVFIEDVLTEYERRRTARHLVGSKPVSVEALAVESGVEAISGNGAAEEKHPAEPVKTAETVASAPAPEEDQDPDKIYLPEDPEPLDFSTPESAARSYRRILRDCKYVRVEPYECRRQLVNRAWEVCHSVENWVPMQHLVDELREYAETNHLGVYPKGIEMILKTLFIARCFDVAEYKMTGFDLSLRVYPYSEIDAGRAVEMMNETYLRGITMEVPSAPLNKEGLALFLYDEMSDKATAAADTIIRTMKPDYDAPTAMQTAFRSAQKQANGRDR